MSAFLSIAVVVALITTLALDAIDALAWHRAMQELDDGR